MSPLCQQREPFNHIVPASGIIRQLPIAMVREATSFDFFRYQDAREDVCQASGLGPLCPEGCWVLETPPSRGSASEV